MKKSEINIILTKQWQIWGFDCMIVEELGVLGCSTIWLVNFMQMFERNAPLSSSGLWVSSQTHNPEDKGNIFLQNVKKGLSNHMAQQSRRPDSWIRKQVCN